MSSSKTDSALKVAVAGANGTLGPPVLKHLIASNYDVTVLSRAGSGTNKLPLGIKIEQVDYSSVESIIPHVRGQDAVVILISRYEAEVQIRIIDAVIAAKVPHLIPSYFGVGTTDPLIRSIPPLSAKVQMEDYVVKKSKEGALLNYTGINTSLFFDWALSMGFLINLKGGPFQVFDGGDVPLSVTTLETIGRAIALALKMPDKAANRSLFIHDVGISQNRLMELASELDPSRKLNPIPADSAELLQKSWDAYNNGDRSGETMRGFLPRASFGGKQLGAFKKVDNALLGIEVKGDDFVKEVLSRFM